MDRSRAKREGWSGGYCDRCHNYAAWLQWGICPRCRRTKAGRTMAEANRKDGGKSMSALTDTDRHLLAAMDLESLGPTAVGKRFTVAKLRAFLRLRGLPVGGSKSDLALRLVRSEKAARGAAQSAERGETVHLSMGGTIGVSIMACRAEEPAGSDQLTKTGDPDKVTCQACRDSTYYQRNAEGFRRLYQRVQK